jgi:threonine dehydrogenase-like Zn-dependent dehydrogenase
MKAVICEDSKLDVVDLPAPEPGTRQVVVEVTGCGICGSDLHARRHADAQADVLAEAGYHGFMRSDQRVVMGHEFVGEVADYGPKAHQKLAIGTPVVALPLVRHGQEMHAVGLSASAPGAYAEQVVVEESLMSPSRTASHPGSGSSPNRWQSATTPYDGPRSTRRTSPS